ncbi:hypothetical protein ACLB2K_046190 [Fragaria x ananassa]
MQKLGFPSMRSLDQFKSLSKSAYGGPPKTFLQLEAHRREVGERASFCENRSGNGVKQKEDEKLWKGLEFKFSSTKTLCYRLKETLQLLAGQVQDAEKDKDAFEGKLSASAVGLDGLSQQMNDLSIKLESAEETIRTREKELEERRLDKEETDKLYRNEQCRTANLVEEKVGQSADLSANLAQRQYDQLHNRFLNITSEKYAIQLVNQELNDRVMELQKVQESIMTQLSKESSKARERIQKLESETEALVSKKIETEKLVSNLQQKHDEKEQSLKGKHSQELKQIQLLAENELIEKVTSMRNEHKAQLRALRLQHEDEIKKLQEDLDLQKSKEYSIPSRRNPVVRRRGQRSLRRQELDEKVICDEYEVETGNGRINRKTRSTVMFEDPRKHEDNYPKSQKPQGCSQVLDITLLRGY